MDRLVHRVDIEKRQLTNPLNLVNKCGRGVGLCFGNMIEKLSVFRCNANEMLCAISSRPVVNWTLGSIETRCGRTHRSSLSSPIPPRGFKGMFLSSGEEGPSGDAIRSRDSRRATDSEILRRRCKQVCSTAVKFIHRNI
jgi:hypothetical protein